MVVEFHKICDGGIPALVFIALVGGELSEVFILRTLMVALMGEWLLWVGNCFTGLSNHNKEWGLVIISRVVE